MKKLRTPAIANNTANAINAPKYPIYEYNIPPMTGPIIVPSPAADSPIPKYFSLLSENLHVINE